MSELTSIFLYIKSRRLTAPSIAAIKFIAKIRTFVVIEIKFYIVKQMSPYRESEDLLLTESSSSCPKAYLEYPFQA